MKRDSLPVASKVQRISGLSINRLTSSFSQRQKGILDTILTYFGFVVSMFDFLYPKDKKTILFGSNMGEFSSGSPKTLFEYIRNSHPEYDVYFYTPFEKSLTIQSRIRYILNSVPIFLRAKFLVGSHPPTDFFPFISWSRKKIFVNMWHGTPLKSIFFADASEKKEELLKIMRLNKRTSAFVVSSRLEAALIERCFTIDRRKLYCLGHPRNDVLLKKNRQTILRNIIKNVPSYKTVILYCPTYRRDSPTKFFPFHDFNFQQLSRFLEENEIIILIRGHVYDKGSRSNLKSDRIIPFGFDVWGDVNSILCDVDILATDYSSIYIDYLLLDRPCIFIPYDLETYQKTTGLLLDYDFWTPGYKVTTYKEFVKAIKCILSGEYAYKSRRQELRDLFHQCQTENSCERVFQLMDRWGKRYT